jgi:hypothetical protein
MVERAEVKYQEHMRRAGHDAILECEGMSFDSLARDELARLKGIPREERDEEIELRIKKLSRLLAKSPSPFAAISDEQLIAEIELRGL